MRVRAWGSYDPVNLTSRPVNQNDTLYSLNLQGRIQHQRQFARIFSGSAGKG